MKQHAPLLAAPADLKKIKYPVLVSAKLDGIRCKVVNGKPLSRKLKLIPNKYVQQVFANAAWKDQLENVDGELIVGKPAGEGVFQRTSSGVMSHEGCPDFTYYVFDVDAPGTYTDRFLGFAPVQHFVEVLPQYLVTEEAQLLRYEKMFLRQGYEGLIGRDPEGLYKHGRSTMKEGILWKLVRYETTEATIKAFKEQMHNDNPAEKDNLGHTKRSTKKAGKRGAGVLGSFVVESENYRDVFDVGTGFTAKQRREFWAARKSLRGKIIRFKHKPIGAVDAPRHPVFQGFRDKRDM